MGGGASGGDCAVELTAATKIAWFIDHGRRRRLHGAVSFSGSRFFRQTAGLITNPVLYTRLYLRLSHVYTDIAT